MHRSKEYGFNSLATPSYFYSDTSGIGCNSPFIALKTSKGAAKSNYISIASKTSIYNDATIWNPALTVAAGAAIAVVWEIDWSRPLLKPDMALTVWASGPGITITQAQGVKSGPGYPVVL